MFYLQNISDEKQLVRIQGEKTVLKPGEIAECLENELSVAKSYKALFSEVDQPENTKTTQKGSTQSQK